MLIKIPIHHSVAIASLFNRQDVPSNSSGPTSSFSTSEIRSTTFISSSLEEQLTSSEVQIVTPSSSLTPAILSTPPPRPSSDDPPESSRSAVSISVVVESFSPVEPSQVPTPTIIPCADPSWTPSPETWASEGVDQKLQELREQWEGDTSFVGYIASLSGQHAQRCGVGYSGSCTVPDCTALQNSGNEKWVYFVSVAIVQLNTFLNLLHSGIDAGKGDLSLALGQMTNDFFHFEPKPTKTPIWPWIGALFATVLAILPIPLGAGFAPIGAALGTSAAAFITGGLSIIPVRTNDPHTFYLGTMQELGVTLMDLSFNTTEALETWANTLFDGKADPSGKTIIDYFEGGRFTLDYALKVTAIQKFYAQTMTSKVINEQWKSPNATTRQFVMCANGTVTCDDRSKYTEDGRTCCLYSLRSDGKYATPPGLDSLGNSTFDIPASNITAGSLHSFLAGGLNYTFNPTSLETSLGEGKTTQGIEQGVSREGTWTLPVCDVSSASSWVANPKDALMPCCCGTKSLEGSKCAQTDEFIDAANLAGWGKFYDMCEKQFPGFKGPPKKKSGGGGLGVEVWWMASFIVLGMLMVW